MAMQPMPINYKTARRLLDTKFSVIRKVLPYFERPAKGWIRAIRNSLGMSSSYLAKQLGISHPRVLDIEAREMTGDLKLSTLERVAQALNCRCVYILIPNESLEDIIKMKALKKAKKILARTNRSMALEGQESSRKENEKQLMELCNEILQDSPKKLWE